MVEPIRQNGLPNDDEIAGKKILVVDDNEYVCDMISKVLTKYLSLAAFKIRGGSQAITAALTGRYDGAIIDLAIQGASGLKVIRTIKTMLPIFPVLVMSAHASEEQIASLTKIGVSRILKKPFKMASLIEEMTGLLIFENNVSLHK
jgi:DNA-binding response OmpR family regulator